MKFNDFDWNDIILEAPEDNVDDTGEEELTATDYADANNLDIEEEDPNAEDNEEDPVTDENGNEDDLGGEDDLNLDDPEGEDNPDETIDDEQIDNGDETENISDAQNKYLVQDFIELFNRLEEIQNVLRNDERIQLRGNPIFIKVRQNLEKLNDVVYDYVINKFSNNSYVANLYQFNLIIQAMNINIQMLENIKEFNDKNKDGGKKKRKTQK